MDQSIKGMSLVEVLIGVLILALAVVPSLSVIFRETKTVTATRDHLSAALWAQKILELTRNYRFDLLDAEAFPSDPAKARTTLEWALKNDPAIREERINNIVYSVDNIRIDPVKNVQAPDQIPGMMLISFAVLYEGADRRKHRLDITSAIFKQQ